MTKYTPPPHTRFTPLVGDQITTSPGIAVRTPIGKKHILLARPAKKTGGSKPNQNVLTHNQERVNGILAEMDQGLER